MKLVTVMNDKIFTNSLVISEGVGIEHRAVMSLLKRHSRTATLSTFVMSKVSTKGRSISIAHLTEIQATFLITLMKNSEKVVDFKERLTGEFYKQRKIIANLLNQKQNQEWLEKRKEGKEVRKELTDMIQKFVAYAQGQGSKSASHYYSNITRMELSGLFILEDKFPNCREVMSIKQLNLIEMADEAIAIALNEGMEQGMNYKDCYVLAKERIGKLAEIFPPSPLPLLLSQSKGLQCKT